MLQDKLAFASIFISIASFVWLIVQYVILSRIRKAQAILFSGKDGRDLEKIILENKNKISVLDGDIQDLYEITSKINELSRKGLHKTGMVRFNPFKDIGGDQSFSVAFLDNDNNGMIISSLYSREGVRVYAKSILDGECEKHQLTDEERTAISIASTEKDNKKRGVV